MRCLITGADGFLAANLVKRLLADGHEVTGAALNRKGQTSLDALGVDCRVEYGDITDPFYVDRIVNATEAEWVFHLAAVSIVRIADANPGRAIRTNILGTLNILESCERHRHVKRVLVASSDKAYGDHDGATYQEDMPLLPRGAYEISKASADQIARLYGAIVTRCANLFGPGDLNWSRLVPNSCRRALRDQPPSLHGGASNYQREWLDVESACDAYLLLARAGIAGEAYNVGSGYCMTAYEMAAAVATIAGAPHPVVSGELGCYEIPSQELDSGKIRRLGWQPRTWPALALRETVDWYAEHLGARVGVTI